MELIEIKGVEFVLEDLEEYCLWITRGKLFDNLGYAGRSLRSGAGPWTAGSWTRLFLLLWAAFESLPQRVPGGWHGGIFQGRVNGQLAVG
jgi:hypothetical protein